VINCKLGPLAECGARELVQVKSGSTVEWAIVGAQAPGYFPLVLLTGDNAPRVINVASDPGDFARYPVAKYGMSYRLAHDPTGPSQIGDGELFRTAGSLVLTEDGDWHLLVNPEGQSAIRWLHLGTGKIMGERGSHKMAFGYWNLCIEGLLEEPSETTLLNYSASIDVAEDEDC
jgi:hypothetical protein